MRTIFLWLCLHICGSLWSQAVELSIEKAVHLALKQNRSFLTGFDDLESAKYEVTAAESEFETSWNPMGQTAYGGGDHSRGRPILGGGLEFNKKSTMGTLVSVAPSLVKRGRHYHSDLDVEVIQPILRGFGKEYQLSNIKSAQFGFRTSYRELIAAQNQLVFRVIEALYRVKREEITARLNRESVHRIDRFYRLTQFKEKLGLSSSLDLYRAELELRQSQDSLESTLERLEESKEELKDLLALPLCLSIDVDVPTEYTAEPVNEERAVEIALTHRAEIDQAEDEARERKRLSEVAKNNLLPQVDLVLNYANLGRTRRFVRKWNKDRENVWSIGLSSGSLTSSVADDCAFQQSILSLAATGREIEEVRTRIVLEIRRTIRFIERSLTRMKTEEAQIQTATGELKLAKIKYDRGLADNFYVIQAEKSLTQAQQNYFCALFDHIVGEYQLVQAMGLLTDGEEVLKK